MKDVYHLQVEAVCIMSFCLGSVSTETASEPELWVQVSFQNLQTQQADNKQGRKQGASGEGGGGRRRL